MNKKTINIAIDGPAGAGKSSLAKSISKHFGFIYIDTGALYRAIAYYVLKKDILPSETDKIIAILTDIKVEFTHREGVQLVFVNGKDVSSLIRTNTISSVASTISAIPEVRDFLMNLQREIAKKANVVMDGRDIGTVVLPEADVKIFLTASVEDRARRRYEEQKNSDSAVSYEEILETMIVRDKNDSSRKVAPLKAAEDSILLDNTGLEASETFELAIKIVRSKINV